MRGKAAACCALVVIAAALIPIGNAAAGASTIWDVQVGAYLEEKMPLRRVAMRFFPDTLSVLQNDVVHFYIPGNHTATLLAPGVDPADWKTDNTGGKDKPYSVFESDEDEGPTAVKLNPNVFLPTVPSNVCGSEADPCVFDGSFTSDTPGKVLNTGLALAPPLDFHVRIDQPAGTSFEVVNLMNPTMELTVNVVEELPDGYSPTSVENQRAADIAADVVEADDLFKTWSAKKASYSKKKDTWTVWTGVDTVDGPGEGGLAIRSFFPKKVTINKGDKVKWSFANLKHVAQTVTLPASRAAQLGQSFRTAQCDTDGDAGEEPDLPATEQPEFPWCESVEELEMDVDASIDAPSGDGKYTGGNDIEHSGARGASFASSTAAYTLRFPNLSPVKKPFKASSVTHPFMKQTVVVK